MPTFLQSASRDANAVPFVNPGFYAIKSLTLAGTGTVVSPIFTLTGSVNLLGLWGVVTTVLGANQTAAYWRLNDQTAQSNITVNTGTTISAAAVGSVIGKTGLAAAALTYLAATQERVAEPTTLETTYFSPCVLVAKPGATTQIEFSFATTDNPTSGVIQFFATFLPLSSDGNLVAV